MKNVRLLLSLFLGLCFCSFVQSQTGKYGLSHSSSTSNGSSWTRTNFFVEIEDYAPKPESVHRYEVIFNQPTLDALGNFCTLSGTLSYQATEGETTSPVGWFQGITIYLAKGPNESVDWPQGNDVKTSEHKTATLKNDGTFLVKFDLRETKRRLDLNQDFQIGVALADHKFTGGKTNRQKVTWSSSTPPLEETIQTIEIPASPEIAAELRLIDEASRWPFEDADTKKLIAAVNALQPLGKEKALKRLREYTDLTNDYFDSHEVVFWIIRLLFEPVDLSNRIRSPAIAVYLGDSKEIDMARHWPLDPIDIVDGVPFMVGRQIGMGGVPEHPMSQIRWVEKFAVIREEPLIPIGNPLRAAEKLFASKKFGALKEYAREAAIESIRKQVFSTLEIEIPKNEYQWEVLTDEVWTQAVKSKAADARWDPASQSFKTPK